MEVNMQPTHGKNVRKYVIAISLFIVSVTLCLTIFFVSLFAYVNHAVEREIWEKMVRQSNHIDSSFNIRFQHLESAADFLGKQDNIHGEIARQYIQSLSENSSMQRVAIYDTDGNAVFNNGDTFEKVELEYIELALQGESNVSNPSKSLVDDVMRFFLSVPIRRGDEIVGVLSGSFNIDELGSLLFEDSYGGQSVLFITDLSGHIIYSDVPSDSFGMEIPKELIDKFERHEAGMAQYRQADGGPLFLLYTPIADSNLLLMHAIPQNIAYEEFHFVQTSVIIVGVVLLVSEALLVIFLIYSSMNNQRNLVQYAQKDTLTELFNKQHTEEAIDLWLKSDACTGIQAMLFMDIDYFKQINDNYGHSVGDDALRFVGQALRQEFRSSDIIGRVGGDEFVVFMRNVPVKHVVHIHAASLRTRLQNAEISGLDKGMIQCSIGIAYAPEHGNTYHDLALCADKALYKTKEHGRDGFSEYS